MLGHIDIVSNYAVFSVNSRVKTGIAKQPFPMTKIVRALHSTIATLLNQICL